MKITGYRIGSRGKTMNLLTDCQDDRKRLRARIVELERKLAAYEYRQTFARPWANGAMWLKPLPGDPLLMTDNAERVAKIAAAAAGKGPVLSAQKWSVPIVIATPDSPRYEIDPTYDDAGFMRFGPIPIPLGAKPSGSPADTDAHLAVWDPETHRAWEMYDAAYAGGQWFCKAGWAYSTDDYTGICPEKNAAGRLAAAATASNFPMLGGLLRPEDFELGARGHRLAFCSPCREAAHYFPATKHGGSGTCGMSEGSLLQLDPDFDVNAYTSISWQRTVLRWWQDFGAYHRDGGGGFAIYRENTWNRTDPDPDPWPAIVGASEYPSFPAGFPWDRLRVLAPNVQNN